MIKAGESTCPVVCGMSYAVYRSLSSSVFQIHTQIYRVLEIRFVKGQNRSHQGLASSGPRLSHIVAAAGLSLAGSLAKNIDHISHVRHGFG